MATFRCSKCGCDEDTALCNYWSARVRDILPVCSACDAKIGKWHGRFPRLFGTFSSHADPDKEPARGSRKLGRTVEAGRGKQSPSKEGDRGAGRYFRFQ